MTSRNIKCIDRRKFAISRIVLASFEKNCHELSASQSQIIRTSLFSDSLKFWTILAAGENGRLGQFTNAIIFAGCRICEKQLAKPKIVRNWDSKVEDVSYIPSALGMFIIDNCCLYGRRNWLPLILFISLPIIERSWKGNAVIVFSSCYLLMWLKFIAYSYGLSIVSHFHNCKWRWS